MHQDPAAFATSDFRLIVGRMCQEKAYSLTWMSDKNHSGLEIHWKLCLSNRYENAMITVGGWLQEYHECKQGIRRLQGLTDKWPSIQVTAFRCDLQALERLNILKCGLHLPGMSLDQK